jgi:uncharacterized protein YjiS (DUF1127 family)
MQNCSDAIALRENFSAKAWRLVRQLGAAAFGTLVEWQDRAEQRHALATMDDRMRKDIGLSLADIARETGKPFWRV